MMVQTFLLVCLFLWVGRFKHLPTYFEKDLREGRWMQNKNPENIYREGTASLYIPLTYHLWMLQRSWNNSLSLSPTLSELASTVLLSFHLSQEERQIVWGHGGKDREAAFKEETLIAFFSYNLFLCVVLVEDNKVLPGKTLLFDVTKICLAMKKKKRLHHI